MVAVDRRIKALLVVQVIALPLATALASNDWGPATAVFFSLVFSEAGLLGLWAAFGKSRRWLRTLCTLVGLVCLSIAIPIAQVGRQWLDDVRDLLISLLVVALPALFAFCVLRRLQQKRGLRLVRSPPLQATSEGIQFSIKHLMAATAIVAAIISIRRGLQSLGYDDQSPLSWLDMTIIVTAIVPCLVLVELATFWAALGLSRPFPRLMVVVPSGFLVGIVPPFYSSSGMDSGLYAIWSGITGFQVLLTAATLLVFRSCGWRMCRETSEEKLISDAGLDSIEEAESSSVFDA